MINKRVNSMKFNYLSNRIIGVSNESIIIWDVQSGELIIEMKDYHEEDLYINPNRRFYHANGVHSYNPYSINIAIASNDDRYVVSGYENGNIQVKDMASGYCIQLFEGRPRPIMLMHFVCRYLAY